MSCNVHQTNILVPCIEIRDWDIIFWKIWGMWWCIRLYLFPQGVHTSVMEMCKQTNFNTARISVKAVCINSYDNSAKGHLTQSRGSGRMLWRSNIWTESWQGEKGARRRFGERKLYNQRRGGMRCLSWLLPLEQKLGSEKSHSLSHLRPGECNLL